jgi:GABA(A) receptor-associated protein
MFKQKFNFKERQTESLRVLEKYPERVPIICEKISTSRMENIDKEKYLVPNDLTAGQFIYVIRKRLHLPAEKAIFLFINGTMPTISKNMVELYDREKDRDGFMYINYSDENVFG